MSKKNTAPDWVKYAVVGGFIAALILATYMYHRSGRRLPGSLAQFNGKVPLSDEVRKYGEETE